MKRFFAVFLVFLLMFVSACSANDNDGENNTDQNNEQTNGNDDQDTNEIDDPTDQTIVISTERGLFSGEDLPSLPVIEGGTFHSAVFNDGCVSLLEGVDYSFSDCDSYGYMLYGYNLEDVSNVYFEAVESFIIKSDTGHPSYSVFVYEPVDHNSEVAQITIEQSDETTTIVVYFYNPQ